MILTSADHRSAPPGPDGAPDGRPFTDTSVHTARNPGPPEPFWSLSHEDALGCRPVMPEGWAGHIEERCQAEIDPPGFHRGGCRALPYGPGAYPAAIAPTTERGVSTVARGTCGLMAP